MNAQDRTSLNRLIQYLKPHTGMIIGSLLAMALVAGAETSIPALMKPLLDRGFTGQMDDKLWQIPVFLVCLALVRSLAQFLSRTKLINMPPIMERTLLTSNTTALIKFDAEFFWKKVVDAFNKV